MTLKPKQVKHWTITQRSEDIWLKAYQQYEEQSVTGALDVIKSALVEVSRVGAQSALRDAAEELAAKARDDDDLVSVGRRSAASWLRERANTLETDKT